MGTRGKAGASSGLRQTMIMMTTMKQAMHTRPGNTPAMNRSAMLCSARTP